MFRIARGDAEAFTVLLKRYEAPLFGYLRRMLGNAADAEEVFQEAFLRVHQHSGRFWFGARFKPWLYRIATNLSRDRLRQRRRHPQVSLDAPVGVAPDGLSLMDCLASGRPDPEQAARASETTARLEAAVAALPVKQRAVFLMARYDSISYEEIARSLRIPVGTVKSRMNKAVHALMQAMQDT